LPGKSLAGKQKQDKIPAKRGFALTMYVTMGCFIEWLKYDSLITVFLKLITSYGIPQKF